jgi:hypothetical protein
MGNGVLSGSAVAMFIVILLYGIVGLASTVQGRNSVIIRCCVVWLVEASISEKHAVSIFSAEMLSRVSKRSMCAHICVCV